MSAARTDIESAAGLSLASPWLPVPFRIRAVRQEIPAIYTFELEPKGGGQFDFLPGQFNMLYVFGNGEVPISISGDPQQPDRLVHTVRAVGKATEALCNLQPGDLLGVRGPFGTSWPVRDIQGKDVLFLTSGLGLAPLRPALYHVLNHRDKYGKVMLLYGARNPERLLYLDELKKWRSRLDLQVEIAVGSAGRDWGGHIGVATDQMKYLDLDPGQTATLICSSERMMRAMIRELNHYGVIDQQIYVSLERNMRCGMGLCGHCQLGPTLICRDGPVYRLDQVDQLMSIREL